jgi:pimeloyl-ACP methyl ester carboxylesterase/DNA-binding CsgD family transcriptional regulator
MKIRISVKLLPCVGGIGLPTISQNIEWRNMRNALADVGEYAAHTARIHTIDCIEETMTETRQQIRFCTSSDGTRIAYALSGRGAPLVKAATWLSHLEFDWTSPVWSHLLGEFAQTHQLIRYDERGCGLSDWEVEDLSFDAWLGDLEAIVDALELERFPLLGISQGASIAIAYAAKHPERVSHLILHGGYARGRLKRGADQALIEEAETMNKLAELGWGQDNPAFRQFFTTQFIPDGTPEQHRWFNELERISTSPKNAARFMREFNDIDVTQLLPKVQCPTIVLHATRDARVPFAEGRLMAGLIPDAHFVPLESSNHLTLQHEAAWSRWVAEVRNFLASANYEDARFATLTARERELIELVAQGRDNAQAAATLGLSEKTIRNRITSIFAKLEVENRAQAIVLARKSGFGEGKP